MTTSTTTQPSGGSMDDIHVADLVSSDPRRAVVFENLGIDYCCGGKISLAQAAIDHNLDLTEVHEQLAAATVDAGEDRDWSTASIEELVTDIIENHHSYVRDELPRMTHLAEKVARAHGAFHPRLIEANAVVEALVAELSEHTDEEEAEVFPACMKVAAGEMGDQAALAEKLSMLVDEHTAAADHMTMLHELLDDFVPPAEACTSWRAYLDLLDRFEQDLHRHVHKENHILFEKVMDRLYASGGMPGRDS